MLLLVGVKKKKKKRPMDEWHAPMITTVWYVPAATARARLHLALIFSCFGSLAFGKTKKKGGKGKRIGMRLKE